MEMNFSRMIQSPVARIRTVPSDWFITSPLIFSLHAMRLMQLLNPTFCTFPEMSISILFTEYAPLSAQVAYSFYIPLKERRIQINESA